MQGTSATESVCPVCSTDTQQPSLPNRRRTVSHYCYCGGEATDLALVFTPCRFMHTVIVMEIATKNINVAAPNSTACVPYEEIYFYGSW